MSNPEPTDVGPIVGGHLLAAESDRAQVRHLLHVAAADGRLTADELMTRVALANAATTFDDLIPLTRDIVALTPPTARGVVATTAPARLPVVDASNANPEPERLLGIFGGTKRTGTWRLRRDTHAIAVMGGHTLDLTDAVFDADVCTVHVTAIMGGVTIKVPAGVTIVDRTSNVMGGTEIKGVDDLGGAGPTLVLTGFCLMGGVEVKGPNRSKVSKMLDVLD